MKIAVWHNLPSGGGKRALYYHVKGLVERGHLVEVWCPSTADTSYLPLSELVVEHVIPFPWKPMHTGGRIKGIFANYRNTMSKMRVMTDVCQRCATEINNGGFDLLFANSCSYYAAPFVTRYVDLPKVLYLQEPFRPFYEASPTLPWVARQTERGWSARFKIYVLVNDLVQTRAVSIRAREEWLNAHACDKILVNSYFSAESIRRAYGLDAEVCYLGIDSSLFKNLGKVRENLVVGVGSIFPNKGLALALLALSRLPKPRPKLVWVGNAGDQDYMNQAKALAKSYEIELENLVGVSDTELVDILNRASCFLHTASLEPFGLAPLEANACATPVVAIKEGGVRETICDDVNGYLVERSPEAIANTILRLLNDSNLARRLGEQGRDRVEKIWSLNQSINLLEQHLYKSLRESRRQPLLEGRDQ